MKVPNSQEKNSIERGSNANLFQEFHGTGDRAGGVW